MELEAGKLKIEGDPFTVELERGQKGGYGWTIKVRGQIGDVVVLLVKDIDWKLRELYGPQEAPAKEVSIPVPQDNSTIRMVRT